MKSGTSGSRLGLNDRSQPDCRCRHNFDTHCLRRMHTAVPQNLRLVKSANGSLTQWVLRLTPTLHRTRRAGAMGHDT